MKNNENAKERKSFKEVIVENKGKIIAGVSIVVASTAGIVLYKNTKDIKALTTLNTLQSEVNSKQGALNSSVVDCMDSMSKELVKVRDIAKEGALEEAIAAVKRKIQYRVGKISDLSARPLDNDALISKELLEKELIILKDKLTMFENEWNNMLH